MKMRIEFEETVKHIHEIVVIGNEEEIDSALNDIDGNLRISSIEDIGNIFEKHGCEVEDINEDYSVDTDSFEYYDEETLKDDNDEDK